MSTLNAVASGAPPPSGNDVVNIPSAREPARRDTNSVPKDVARSQTPADFTQQFIQLNHGSAASPIQSLRQQSLEAGFRSVELVASKSSFQNGIMETASVIYRQARVNLNISSTVLESYAREVDDLENLDPELLQDYLALIKLLDEKTPDSFDPFFDRLRNILKGNPEAESLQRETDQLDLNVAVETSASREVQVQEFFFNIEVSVSELTIKVERQVQKSDPLVLDLDDDGIEVSSIENGRSFDINADGVKDQTSFVFGGDAFLALDRNNNGSIDDGSELFGDQNGAADGFLELSKFDNNNDSRIDSSDPIFDKLLLFDGLRTFTLNQAGVSTINTVLNSTPGQEINGNQQLGYSSFLRQDGSSGKVSDLNLNFYS